jgi:hypothetical protein
VDFSKPVKAPGTRACPPDIELPRVGDEDTGAGSDFFVWKNVLPDSPGKAHNVSSPMDITNPAIGTGVSLAARLHWTVFGETDHKQVEIKIGESEIRVDREMAVLVKLLNETAKIATATSCSGSITTSAYIMFVGVGSALRFLRIWQRYLVPLGHPVPELEFTARDEEWRVEIGSEFPFPQAVPVDDAGLTYSAVWREHREDMIEIMPKLAWALRCHLGESAEA